MDNELDNGTNNEINDDMDLCNETDNDMDNESNTSPENSAEFSTVQVGQPDWQRYETWCHVFRKHMLELEKKKTCDRCAKELCV